MSYYRVLGARPIPVNKAELAKLADQFVKVLPKYLKFRDMSQPLWSTRGYTASWGFDLGKYETKDVMGNLVRVPVKVTAKTVGEWNPTRNWIAGGVVRSQHHGPRGHGIKFELGLKLNADRTPEEILSHLPSVKKEVFSVLIHEVTHLRDVLHVEGPKEDPQEKAQSYHNKPSEVRAFMQQAAHEVLDFVEKEAQSFGIGPWGAQLNGKLLDRALSASLTWSRIQEFLTPTSRKTLLRGVTRAVQDEWPRLYQKYKDDDF